MTWKEVPQVDQNGFITAYEVLYEPLDTFNDFLNISVMNVTAVEFSVVLTNLQEFVTYSIIVRAYTSIGPGPYSDAVYEMTLEDSPGSPPVNVTVYLSSATSVVVNWQEVPPIHQNGIITLYEVICEPLEVPDRDLDLETLTMIQYTSNQSVYLSDLEGFVTYSISVRAFTAVGVGPYSVPQVTTTLEDGEL